MLLRIIFFMDDQKREELLIRLDERTKSIVHDLSGAEDSIKKSIEKIIQHQEEQNGHINACLRDIKSHETSINLFKWVAGIVVTAFLTFLGFFITHIIKG